MPELVRTLQDVPVVVFHCSLSQQRGPKAARNYLRMRGSGSAEGQQEVFVLEGGFIAWQAL